MSDHSSIRVEGYSIADDGNVTYRLTPSSDLRKYIRGDSFYVKYDSPRGVWV